eukprot:TRINITY_DN13485_c0_g1_i4.p1 TRINITY_DN13485_c0_g1~~TRINITY_DN13485_c0_g1_i4.p1  ORF type:complete len:696 (-),score=73.34 TRINITY_DN13485_c0_g1_i4:1844-3931(-)
MFKQKQGQPVACDITIHTLARLPYDGFLTYVGYKVGHKRERSGSTKQVLAAHNNATWEEQFRIYCRVAQGKPKILKLKVHKVKPGGSDRVMGNLRVNISAYLRVTPDGEVRDNQVTETFPVKLVTNHGKAEGILRLTVRLSPPAANISAHLFDEDTTTAASSRSHDTEQSDEDVSPFTGGPSPIGDTPVGPACDIRSPPAVASDESQRRTNGVPRSVGWAGTVAEPFHPERTFSPKSTANVPPSPPAAQIASPKGMNEDEVRKEVARQVELARAKDQRTIASLQRDLAQKEDALAKLTDQFRRLKRENEFRMLTEAAVTTATPAYLGGTPLGAVLIYKCLHHWKVFSAASDSGASLRRLTGTVKAVCRRQRAHPEEVHYWLSASFTLYATLCGEVPTGVTLPAEESNEISRCLPDGAWSSALAAGDNVTESPYDVATSALCLTELRGLVTTVYTHGVSLAREQIGSTLLSAFFGQLGVGTTAESGATVQSVLQVLDTHCGALKAAGVPIPLRGQFLAQVLRCIASIAFNALLDVPSLCTFGTLTTLKSNIGAIEKWVSQNKDSLLGLGKDQLGVLRQAANMLMIGHKESLLDDATRQAVCPSLSEAAVARLLENYTTDEFDRVGIPYESIRALKYRRDGAAGATGHQDPALVFSPCLPTIWPRRFAGSWPPARAVDPGLVPEELRNNTAFAFLFE